MRIGLFSAAAMLAAPLPAAAQALSCTAPRAILAPHADGPSDDQPVRRLPIGSYTLALSWIPQFCRGASAGHADNRFECRGQSRFGFALHGLWPDGEGKEWPQYCKPVDILPQAILRENICTTPSAQLLQHEWAKHGSCTGETPKAYFASARGLYGRLRFPDMNALSRRQPSAGAIAQAFARANPGIPARAVRVTTTRDGWLDELWLCLDRNRRFRACAPEQGGGVSSTAPVKIWRVRPGFRTSATARRS